MKPQRFILLIVLSIVALTALFLMSQEIIDQNDEIMALRERVFKMELIAGYPKDFEGFTVQVN